MSQFLNAILPAVLFFAFAAAGFCLDFEIKPVNINEAEYARLKDRISVSLFFRGELADKIMEAGLQNSLLEPGGVQTRAETREALINWAKKNPDQAANLYFYLSRSGTPGALRSEIKYSVPSWEINPRFLGLLNALKEAAGDKGLSDEALNLAAGRMFEGPQAAAKALAAGAGGLRTQGTAFFSGYADYKLNRAGLERELKNLRAWTDSLREGFERSSAPRLLISVFDEALSAYGSFAASAAVLKSRSALTAAQSTGLEQERRFVRNKLAALTLLKLAARVNKAAAGLGGEDAGLLEEAKVLSGNLEKTAGDFAAGPAGSGDMARVLPSAHRACELFCARAAAAGSLLAARLRLKRTFGFSCLYDYLSCLWFERFYPAGPYAQFRSVLRGGEVLLRRSRSRLENGRWNNGSSDLAVELSAFSVSLEAVEKASAFNKRTQFFFWGLVFRPAELEVSFASGKLSFKPAFTFFRIIKIK